MDGNYTRRALLGAILGGGVAAGSLSPVRGYLERFAPYSGSAWAGATERPDGTVENPYGAAELRYDDYGVPHLSADDEQALYFAVGYTQAADRLFQLDLQRRLMRGQLSAVVGERAFESDEFHVKMDFAGAAEANWEMLGGTETEPLVEAFSEGVNHYIDTESLPIEFSLLSYEPAEWTPADTMLMEKQISWNLTGSFRTLRRALLADKLGEQAVEELYPARLDHDYPIIREGGDGNSSRASQHPSAPASDQPTADIDTDFVGWLDGFESPPGIGSNSWIVSGEMTESGTPLLANDPHLGLMAPPVWYEMHVETEELNARGVTFPGVPFVVIGENDAGAWGFTNGGADVIDFYSYETDESGDRYRYRGNWREFDTETREIEISDAKNREVTVKKSVHGPLVEREDRRVGVSWTGHTATRTTLAVRELNHSDGMADAIGATEKFDVPTQNLVYADRDGNTLYYLTGKIPIRTNGARDGKDGEEIAGDRIFDGSVGEGEWQGFEPFGTSSWEGFVPFEEKPHVRNPDYLATANQRIVDDPEHYIAEAYSTPYRGKRIYDMLDERVAADDPMNAEFMREIQLDTLDGRAATLVPELVKAVRSGSKGGTLGEAVQTLADWDYRMDTDSRGALLFARWFDQFRTDTFKDDFEQAGLDESYYPSDWVLANLPADSRWFGEKGRKSVLVDALRQTLEKVEGETTYGDYSHTGALTHPFDLGFLNYPEIPKAGTDHTVNDFSVESATGVSWRMVCPMDGDSQAILPGGNSGDYFSDHYDDQLKLWAGGEYKPMGLDATGDLAVEFEEAER
ncbi:penicillin acylase family protein [Halorussus halophilus]|uniref:penicillin acylase family protein n=1 Tax=Halorussus halophilus TaxID=2650975 RepID=UPI00130145AF|nr:penicillin acylase family protein [Halorussus halophilus]